MAAVWQYAQAQAFPAKPLRLVIPYPAGGGTDIMMRPFAQHLAERLGQSVVIDNRGGGGGAIGMEAVARAAPDGYTIVIALTAQLAVNPALYKNLSYDPVRDFAPITLFANGPYLLVVHPSLPVKSVKELIELARKRPNEITYGSAGSGSGAHLAAERLKTMTGIKMVHVPYKGGGPALTGLLSGEVQVLFPTWSEARGFIKEGRIRALAVTTAKRPKGLPDIAPIAEAGVPGYDSGVWYALLAPAGTPRAIVDRLNREAVAVLNNPDYSKLLLEQAIDPVGSTPEELAQHIRREIDKWAKVVKDAAVSIE
jgi:tripartite-type tricarboxylate transporter receptor subunit TctC